jgi:hypothetical protein
MTQKTKGLILWIFAIIFTLGIAVYQRTTGPTYPANGAIEFKSNQINYKLLRSANSDEPATIKLSDIPQGIEAELQYRRFKTDEPLKQVSFIRQETDLIALLPPEPPAGKLAYTVYLISGDEKQAITIEPTVLRFKGPVPDYILIPHILFMFLAMLFSSRTGIEALAKGPRIKSYSFYTLIFLFFGGMLLGPVVQKFAFGEYWTGWPFGGDLTDNKTAFAFLGWLVAYFFIRKNSKNRYWAIIAAVILLAVYLIPHSMFGSELDYDKGTVETGK